MRFRETRVQEKQKRRVLLSHTSDPPAEPPPVEAARLPVSLIFSLLGAGAAEGGRDEREREKAMGWAPSTRPKGPLTRRPPPTHRPARA